MNEGRAISSHHLPSLAGGSRSARLATLRTMAWTADRDISHSRLTAVTPIAATAAASASS